MRMAGLVAGLILMSNVFGGCRSYPVRPMPAMPADEAPVRTAVAGTAFGAKAYEDGAEIKAIFNYDLMSKGVLPVLLVVDNDTHSELEILRARIDLETGGGELLDAMSPDAASTGHGRNAVGEAVFFFGIFSYDDANRFNDDLQRDWVEKGWPEVQLLRSGRTACGFLYFEVGEGFSPSGATLRVPFDRDGRYGRETAVLRFD